MRGVMEVEEYTMRSSFFFFRFSFRGDGEMSEGI